MIIKVILATTAICSALLPTLVYNAQAQTNTEQQPIGMQLPAVQTLPSKEVLLVVGNENRTVLPGTSISDVFVRNRLELDMEHQVTVIADTASSDRMLAAANAADLVIIAESVTSSTVGTKLVSTPTPILFYEAFLPDEFGLVNPATRGVDPGTPDRGDYGAIEGQTHINIVNAGHQLAAGFEGVVQVYRFPREMNWGRDVAASVEVIATVPEYPSAALIYFLRRGATRYDGTPSAGLRLSFFVENDNDTGTFNLMTNHGLRLFDAAVDFALTTGPAR